MFELRQQLSSHVFRVVFVISLAMVLGSVSVEALRVGPHSEGLHNGADAIVHTHLVWTLFFMFTTGALVADAVLRDELVGFAPILRATPVRWLHLVWGRFAGAFAAVLLCFLSVPLGIVAGSALSWAGSAPTGPIHEGALAFAFVVIGIPNLLLSASLSFALTTLARSLNAALIGALVLLILYGLGARTGASLPALLEPFGFAAYAEATSGWTQARRDTGVPPLAGSFLLNRLLVLALSGTLLAVAGLRTAAVWRSRQAGDRRARAAVPPVKISSPLRIASGRPLFIRQFAARLALETGQILRAPAFAVLLLLGVANAAAAVWAIRGTGDPRLVARTVSDAFQLAPIVIALFFTGELRWMERERGISSLLEATPLAPSAFLLPKFTAVAIVLVAVTGVTGLAAALVLAAGGGLHAALLLPAWFGAASYNALMFAALALFLQAVASNKLAGWGLTILFLIGSLALDRLGFNDPWYRYGRYPGWSVPAQVSGELAAWHYQVYWTVVAALLLKGAVLNMRPSGWPMAARSLK